MINLSGLICLLVLSLLASCKSELEVSVNSKSNSNDKKSVFEPSRPLAFSHEEFLGKEVSTSFKIPKAIGGNGKLSYEALTTPLHGSLSGCLDSSESTNCTYTPNKGYTGVDIVQFKASDSIGSISDIVNLTINVEPAPNVISIVPNGMDGGEYVFTIDFDQKVSGVDPSDFIVDSTGSLSGSIVTTIDEISPGKYKIKVDPGTGEGTFDLGLVDDGSIVNENGVDLAGQGAGSGDFSAGAPTLVDLTAPVVTSVLRNNPMSATTSAGFVEFLVSFSEEVSGVDAGSFFVTAPGISNISIVSVNQVGATSDVYSVRINTGSGNGTIRLDVLDADIIKDAYPNPLGGIGASNGNFNTGEVYTLERSGVYVASITRKDPNPTNSASVDYNVVFSEAVSGVDLTDFAIIQPSGSLTGFSISNVVDSGDQITWVATLSTGTGDGELRLDFEDDDTVITLANSTPIGGVGLNNGGFSSGDVYTINHSFPVVSDINSIGYTDNAGNKNIIFEVIYSEDVSGVDTSDFSPLEGGTLSGSSVLSVTKMNEITYNVELTPGTSGSGSLDLSFVDDDSVIDQYTNPVGGAGLANGSVSSNTFSSSFNIDRNLPSALSINRSGGQTSLYAGSSASFDVTFSEAVSNVDMEDFLFKSSGTISGAYINNVSTTDNITYTVTIDTGSGSGDIWFELIDDDSIEDVALNKLGGTGLNNGDLTSSEKVTIDRSAPSVSGVTLLEDSPSNKVNLTYRVTFSEIVSGVDVTDFSLSADGTVMGYSVLSVLDDGDQTNYTITVNTGTGDGSLTLNVIDDDTIVDVASYPLGGNGAGNGNVTGATYLMDRVAPGPPAFSSITPTSPGSSTQPFIKGTAPMDTDRVQFFKENTCSNQIGDGTRNDFVFLGYPANMNFNSTTDIWAQTLDSSGNASACTFLTSYEHILSGQKILPPSVVNNSSYYGKSISINGNWLAIGSERETDTRSNQGVVYIYSFDGSNWVFDQKIVAPNPQSSNYFGRSVSVGINQIVVGEPDNDDFLSNAGAAHVYTYDGTDWNLQATLLSSSPSSSVKFGYSLDIEGDIMAIKSEGSPYRTEIFKWNGVKWNSVQMISSTYGRGVKISGEWIALIGNSGSTGNIKMYRYNGTNWDYHSQISKSGVSTYFGESISMDSGVIIVGDYNKNGAGTKQGEAYIYRFDGTSWNLEKTLTAADIPGGLQDNDFFGKRVAHYQNSLVVTAYGVDGPYAENLYGMAYYFKYDGVSDWIYQGKFRHTDGVDSDQFGLELVMDKNHVIIGSPYQTSSKGAAYAYKLDETYPSIELSGTRIPLGGVDTLTLSGFDGTEVISEFFGGDKITISGKNIIGNSGGSSVIKVSDDSGNIAFLPAMVSPYIHSAPVVSSITPLGPGTEKVVNLKGSVDPDAIEVNVYLDNLCRHKIMGGTKTEFETIGLEVPIKLDDNHPIYVQTKGSAFDGNNWYNSECTDVGSYDNQLVNGELQASSISNSDNFGREISIDGKWMALGTPYDDEGSSNSGSVFIYEWNGTSWVEHSKIASPSPVSTGQFGYSVSIKGDRVIIGEIGNDYHNTDNGASHIYRFDGTNWTYEQVLYAGNSNSSHSFGRRVSINGDTALVSTSGFVYVFRYNGIRWNKVQSISVSTNGYDLISSGDKFAVDRGGSYVSIYKFDGSSYVLEKDLNTGNSHTSIDFQENVLVVGQSSYASYGSNSGRVRIYRYDGTDWLLEESFTAPDKWPGDQFGYRVSYNSNLLIASARYNDELEKDKGAIYFYKYDVNSSSWQGPNKLNISNIATKEIGVGRLKVSADEIFIGQYTEDSSSGKVFWWNVDENIPKLNVDTNEIALGGTVNLNTVGGSGGESYSIVSGSTLGTLVGGVFTAGLNPGTVVFKVIDSDGNVDYRSVYIQAVPLADPVFASLTPTGPGTDKVVTVVGSVDGNTTSVSLHRDASCLGTTQIASGTKAEFEGAGLSLYVDLGSTTNIYAKASGATFDGNNLYESNCVLLSSYTNTLVSNFFQAPTPSNGSSFANEFDVDGKWMVVGEPYADTGGTNRGQVHIYEWNGSTWVFKQTLLDTTPQNHEYFGRTVAISGDRILVGAESDDTVGTDVGKAVIYKFDGTNWTLQDEIYPSITSSSSRFGVKVDIQGDVAVIGAASQSRAYIFRWNGTEWYEAQISNSGHFSTGLKISGNNIAMQSGGNVNFYSFDGTSFVYDKTIDVGSYSSEISLSNDVLSVGYTSIDGVYDAEGKARVYRYDGSNWNLEQELKSPIVTSKGQNFGFSTDIVGKILVVSERGDDQGGTNSGAIYMYKYNTSNSTWEGPNKIVSTLGNNSLLGNKVVLRGNYVYGASLAYNSSEGAIFNMDLNENVPILSLSNDSIGISGSTVLSTSGGSGGEVYSIIEGASLGTLVGNTFTAGTTPGTVVFQVIDSAGNISYKAITIEISPLGTPVFSAFSPTSPSTAKIISLTGTIPSDATEVKFYFDSSCVFEMEVGTKAEFEGAGVNLYPNLGTVTTVYAVATDSPGTRTSDCTFLGNFSHNFSASGVVSGNSLLDSSRFGANSSISGDWLAVGVPYDGGGNSGAIQMYNWNGTSWVYDQTIKEVIPKNHRNFGENISLSGKKLVVGIPRDAAYGSDSGKAIVYTYDGTDWGLEEEIYAQTPNQSEQFGRSVSIQGDTLIIGQSSPSRTFVYRWNGTKWNYIQDLDSFVGYHVKIKGDKIAMINGYDIELYKFDGSSWNFEQTISNGSTISNFDLFGDVLAIGEGNYNGGTSNSGRVRVWRYDGSNWAFETQLSAKDKWTNNYFGSNLKLSNNYLAIGSYGNNESGSNRGAIYVYEYNSGTTSWEEPNKISGDYHGVNNLYLGKNAMFFRGSKLYVGIPEHSNSQGQIMWWDLGDSMPYLKADNYIVGVSGSINLSTEAGGGSPVYSIDFGSGNGSLVGSAFTASSPGTVRFKVTDANGDVSYTSILIEAGVLSDPTLTSITPLGPGGDVDLTVIGSLDATATEVSLFLDNQCREELVTDTKSNFESTGSSVKVFYNYVTTIYARAKGAIYDGNNFYQSNCVSLGSSYTNNVTSQQLSYATPENSDLFGQSIASEGNWLVVGVPSEDGAQTDSGSVEIYSWNGSSWVLDQKLTPPVEYQYGSFGYSVGISIDKIIVGERQSGLIASRAGAAHIYKYDGTDWVLEQTIAPSTIVANEYFGSSVDIEGDTAVIGSGGSPNSLYVSKFDGTNWNLNDELSGYHSVDVSISGNWIASMHGNRVNLFLWDGANFIYRLNIDVSGASKMDLYGNHLAIGNSGYDGSYLNVGQVRIYKFGGGIIWNHEQTINPSHSHYNQYFGSSVCLDGTDLLVGSYGVNRVASSGGGAYKYSYDGSSTWSEDGFIAPTGALTSSNFGKSCAINAGNIFIGGPNHNSSQGEVQFFDLP